MNERQYLAQLESASAAQLADMLRQPTIEEERLLAQYFGEERLARLRYLALGTQRRGISRGNVVVLHGIMGGELTLFPKGEGEPGRHIWMSIPRIVIGAIDRLRITPEFKSEYDVRPTGIMKKWYAEMLLGLAADQWNVQSFFYDWRLDLADIADALRARIDGWFGTGEPVNLVAHSMGGLVSRTFILKHPDRWNRGGRLIMLGTPNHGSFAIPQMITGALDTVHKLALLDLEHNRGEIQAILNTMPGAMQMLPSPFVMPSVEWMYDANTWGSNGPAGKLLDLARASHERLASIVDRERMSYIAGCNQVTKADVADRARLDDPCGYTDSLEGDGTVPHALGFLDRDRKPMFPVYFMEAEHGALPNNLEVIAATQQLLATGLCSLPQQPPKPRAMESLKESAENGRERESEEEAEVQDLSRRIQAQARSRGDEKVSETITVEEIRAGELLVRSFLAGRAAQGNGFSDICSAPASTPSKAGARRKTPTIEIRLVHGGIEDSAKLATAVDAIAVGHYIGVKPQNAELALDCAISKSRFGHGAKSVEGDGLLITELQKRGHIVGGLGQNFLFPDPRDPNRVIVIAGMGMPGAFGEAELAVLARELVWMLGRMGKRHLFTVLIGAGVGNLDVAEAIHAWMRGIRRALYDVGVGDEPTLKTVTFVEFYAENYLRLDRTLKEEAALFASDIESMRIIYEPLEDLALKKSTEKAEAIAKNMAVAALRRRLDSAKPTTDFPPVRLTIRLARDTFEFAALTADASMPRRETRIDPTLIDEVNDLLPMGGDAAEQEDQGHLLGRLLLPEDLRDAIVKPSTPVVAAVDRSTARFHWEMLALAPSSSPGSGWNFTGFKPENFLGTACGFTRQLQTSFAPLPEPPLFTGRALRVLIVADPAEDAPLAGAQEEGEVVWQIFQRLKSEMGVDVDVVPLLGPRRATRVAVLEQLINHRFDMLHYAGHCFFNARDPSHCGWIFTGKRLLSAHELNRIDRIPRFVFSNACESGITPNDRDKRSALLGPSFAEAFFARGVANFVCTAWPVDDAAALAFARRFYEGLLGLRAPGGEAMNAAMAAARAEIAQSGLGGLRSWGAYQHYGDPNFRIAGAGSVRLQPAAVSHAALKAQMSAKPTAKPRTRVVASRRAKERSS